MVWEGGGPYVCNSKCGKVVSFVLATHPLASALSAFSQVRRYIAAATGTQAACALASSAALLVFSHGVDDGRGSVVRGRHGVLERTSGCEMFALTDTALDFLVPQLLFKRLLLRLAAARLGLLGLHVLPVARGSEEDVLAHRCRVRLRSLGFSFLQAELCPFSPLGNHRVQFFFDRRRPSLACDFDFLALIVEAEENCRS